MFALIEKALRRRFLLAAALYIEYVAHKPLRRQLGWAFLLYVASVSLFAGVCGALHLAIMLLYKL
ncbi:hypothetical protein [Paraburkholderia sediminicola]|uniref:hypothetical protein n=1 Tax=Paraburkholderia sediminicola TaxID=458836 RepID=UPI0038B6F48B